MLLFYWSAKTKGGRAFSAFILVDAAQRNLRTCRDQDIFAFRAADVCDEAGARDVGMRTIQRLMGHNISTTALYCDVSDETLRSAVELF